MQIVADYAGDRHATIIVADESLFVDGDAG
jgi:hypothetical protein